MLRLTALLLTAMLAAAPARAQMANLPKDVQAKIAALGPVLNPDMIKATIDALTPVVAAVPRQGIRAVADIAYGPDARNKLDVYVPEKHGRAMPVVIFIHGGGFVRGDKNAYGPIYGNVTAFFARHGIMGVNATYRLAPAAAWPAGAEDVGLVVAWVKANAKAYGADPNRIFVMGHSAGATHVAGYVFDAKLHPAAGAGIAGAILVSGVYRVTQDYGGYFGKDESQYGVRSPVTHLHESKTPLFLVMAEYDPVELATPTLELMQLACVRDGKCPRFMYRKGHNHISETASFDTRDSELGNAIVEFVRTTK